MTTITSMLNLPVELRWKILSTTLPADLYVSKPLPSPILELLCTSRQVNEDMTAVLKSWRPVHHITQPAVTRPPCDLLPPPNVLCLSFFYEEDEMGVYTLGRPWLTPRRSHYDYVHDWTQQVSALPTTTVKTLIIDAMSAPGWMREGKPEPTRTYESRPGYRIVKIQPHQINFLRKRFAIILEICALAILPELMRVYDSHFGRDTAFHLEGKYGLKSKNLIEKAISSCAERDRLITFTGTLHDVAPQLNL